MAESMEVDEEGPVRHLLSVESIKMMGESAGVGNLNEDAASRLCEDLEYRLKEIVQDSVKFMRHSKRKRLLCSDMDNALKVKNIEPLYGFDSTEYVPFRHTSGGGKDLYFPDEKEVSLFELINAPLPRLPCDLVLKSHWLCVEGVQPAISENPLPLAIDDQREEGLATSLPHVQDSDPVVHVKDIRFAKKAKKKEEGAGSVEWSKLKPLQAHVLSLEQQLYYKEITDACVGLTSESKCQEALNSLATDPGLYQLLPQFISFINEGIKLNIAQRKLSSLKHLLKMVSALLENSTVSLEKYLHEIIPPVLSCLINRQVCIRPEAEDHWSLRDLAGKILAKICTKYSNSVNNIQPRITRIFTQALKNNTQGLAVHYGAFLGLIELGHDVITSLVITKLKQESEQIRAAQGQPGRMVEQVAANRVQSLLQRHCAPVLMSSRPTTDTLLQYQEDYGHLGQALFNQVKTLRQNRASLQTAVTARVASPTLKSPTVKRPPPLTISPQMLTIKGSGNGSTKTPSPIITSLSSPTIAAALRLVQSQSTSSTTIPGMPTVSTASAATLIKAVMTNPDTQAALMSAVLSSNLQSPKPKTPTQQPPITTPPSKVTQQVKPKTPTTSTS